MNKTGFLIVGLFVCVLLTGCGNSGKSQAEKANSAEKPVRTEIARMVETEERVEFSALLQPLEETLLSFEVPGRIVSLEKKESDNAGPGDVLAGLDASEYRIRTEIAGASLGQAEANLNQTLKGARDQEIENVKAVYEKAKAVYDKAVLDVQRVENLWREQFVSQSDYELALTNLSVAQNDFNAAQAAYDLILEGASAEMRELAEAGYRLAEGNNSLARLALEKTQLMAPFEGTILAKFAANGQLVAAGTPVFRFGNIDTLKLNLAVPDYNISAWSKDDLVTVSLYGREKPGVVSNIAAAANVQTGTVNVEVTIENPDHDWLPGQVAVCSHVLKSHLSIFVPVEAIVSLSGASPYVFVKEDGRAVPKQVTLGKLKDNRVQILSGLESGSEVIVSGAGELFAGVPVKNAGGEAQ